MNERQVEAERALEHALGSDGFDRDPEDVEPEPIEHTDDCILGIAKCH